MDPPRPLDWHGTRREPRFGVRGGVEIQLDGNPAAVVNVSTGGAQVVSGTILRPNQKVRVTIPNGDLIMRFRGAIVWAKFELSKAAAPPVYRAGVAFLDSDDAAMDRYAANVRL
ncbi:MAG: PilZ domain-containing protein [Acidobacteria bacterium]|nr:PilZ domain-containing protein [Acidobacteriota bacterium]